MAVKPTAAMHIIKRQVLDACAATLGGLMLQRGVSDSALRRTAGYAASAAELEGALVAACANSSTTAGKAAAFTAAATAAMSAYVSVGLGRTAAAESLAAEAASVLAAGFDGYVWRQLGADSWCQVLASLHLDLVKIKMEQKPLLREWAGAEGEGSSWSDCNIGYYGLMPNASGRFF